MIHQELYTLISGDAGVSAITTSIYPVSGPQNTTFPVIVYTRIHSDRRQNFDEVENFVRSIFMVDSYAETYNATQTLAEAVKTAVNDYKGGTIHRIKLESENDILESETDLFRVSQNYDIWHTE